MAWTQTDLDKLEAAIASGARRVRFQTHEVEYQSLGDMMRARDLIKSELTAGATGGVSLAEYSGGAL